MNVIDVLEKARARIKQGWCTGILEDGHGNVCAVGAVLCSCGLSTDAVGALESAYHSAFRKAIGLLASDPEVAVLVNENDDWDRVAEYNNKHTRADVLALFDRTIANLKAARGVEKLKELTIIPVDVPVVAAVDG